MDMMQGDGNQPKVLVVDDSILIRKMISSILAHQFEVLEAKNGFEGLDMARQALPDLILLDFVMPDLDGYETLQALRQESQLSQIPVIMMSGVKEEVINRIPEPFETLDFLEKPFAAEVLIERIYNRLPLDEALEEPQFEEATINTVLHKLTEIETLLIQGTEGLIQREVVSRLTHLDQRTAQQETRVGKVETILEKLLQEVKRQNQGLAFVANELKQIRQALKTQSE
jgi:CheY-like chemotaxis protein